ncbi:MAG: HDOD domain-containing protein [Gammaproteobacteria bacterium]|nr:HDOD domain-containing protein [Gammaproteobacteria bacterium]
MKKTDINNEQELLNKVLSSQINVPPQPAILLEIDKLINKPNPHLTVIGNLINKDVGLTAAIFELVNSSFYQSPTPIISIQKAITVLGLTQVTNLIKTMSLRKEICGNSLVYEKFWGRSEEIATLSAIIARKQISACNIAVDQAYMAGLFQDCGVPILMQRFPEYCRTFRLNKGSNWPDLFEEDKRFNTDHTVVGFLVTKHWGLPEFICQAVRYHHDRLNVDYAALTLVSILQMAQHLHNIIHDQKDAEWSEIGKQVLEEIGVSREGAVEFMEDAIERFNQQ